MSTCPNKELWCAYADDEIDSPWKEQLERHLQECCMCRKIYDRYTLVGRCMQREAVCGCPIDYSQSFTKLLAKKEAMLAGKREAQKNTLFGHTKSWFYASVRVPVPVAVAAVLLFVLMPVVLFLRMEKAMVSASNSFIPVLPISFEKSHYPFNEPHSGVIGTSVQYGYIVPNKTCATNTKIFTVSGFTSLYSEDDTVFAPAELGPDFKISLSLAPVLVDYSGTDYEDKAVSVNSRQ